MLSLNASGGRLVDRIRRLLGESPMKERSIDDVDDRCGAGCRHGNRGDSGSDVADASELVVSAIGQCASNPPQVPAAVCRARPQDAESTDWADYVRETQAALETLARETQGVAVLPRSPGRSRAPAAASLRLNAAPQAQPRLASLRRSPGSARPQPPLPPVPPLPPPSLCHRHRRPAPAAPAPPVPPNAQVAFPALPAPPAPPAAAARATRSGSGLDPRVDRACHATIAESFEELRRATEEVGLKQEAIRQAQAEMAKMRIESLAAKAQIEVMQKTLSEFSAKSAASQLDGREMQKLLDELSAEIAKLRAR